MSERPHRPIPSIAGARVSAVSSVLDQSVIHSGISLVRFGHPLVHLFDEGLGRHAKSLGKPKNHIQRGRPDRLLKPRNVAPLQSAIPGKIRLAPSLAKPPANNDLGKTRTEMIDFVQTDTLSNPRVGVAVTIGPAMGLLVLTRTCGLDPIALRMFGKSSPEVNRQASNTPR